MFKHIFIYVEKFFEILKSTNLFSGPLCLYSFMHLRGLRHHVYRTQWTTQPCLEQNFISETTIMVFFFSPCNAAAHRKAFLQK